MQVYSHMPLGRIAFLIITIVFHAYMLIRAAAGSRYLIAFILVIPVTAVSIVLARLAKTTVIRAAVNNTGLELGTLAGKHNYDFHSVSVAGKHILAKDGRKFIIKPSKAELLVSKLNEYGAKETVRAD
ncbi:MAG: hypothetical protein CVU89_16995 [Firmicutes bacterium HGW-Firmicutes-14]|nr:MAG: hypothetical protein CVU89_16995 [Firmicutes bacterium HGW-Firmicutes-14]